ncbi:MAG: HEAT repeat domain-containing protein [Planctomycetota bacterium]
MRPTRAFSTLMALGLCLAPVAAEELPPEAPAERWVRLATEDPGGLGMLGEPGVNPAATFARMLRAGEAPEELQVSFASALSLLPPDPEAVPDILAVIEAGHPDVGPLAALTLRGYNKRYIRPDAIRMLERQSIDPGTPCSVRQACLVALDHFDPKKGAEIALHLVRTEPMASMREAALEVAMNSQDLASVAGIRQIQDAIDTSAPANQAALVRLLGVVGDDFARETTLEEMCTSSDDPAVREAAAEVLAPHGSDAALQALTDPARRVRKRVAVALARAGDERAIPGLIRLVRSRDRDERDTAVWALQEITGEDYGTAWREWGRWWHRRELAAAAEYDED